MFSFSDYLIKMFLFMLALFRSFDLFFETGEDLGLNKVNLL